MTIQFQSFVDQQCQKFGKHIFIADPHRTLTFSEVQEKVHQYSAQLETFDFNKIENLAVYSQNSIDEIIILLTLWYRGHAVCLLNTRLPDETIYHQLKDLQIKHIFTNNILNLSEDFEQTLLDQFLSSKMCEQTNSSNVFNENLTLLFTSGSTSQPKAAVHSFENYYFSAEGANEHIPFNISDRWLMCLPLYHVSGLSLLFRSLLGGGSIYLHDKNTTITDSIKNFHITHISTVPLQLNELIESSSTISTLKAVLCGGSKTSPELISQSLNKKIPLYLTYGLTEMTSQVCTTEKITSSEHIAGKVLKHRQIKIDKNDEIFVKGRTLFNGYFLNGQIQSAVDEEGWFHTGDLGKIINGQLSVFGRKDNQFVSGGENIQPEEIEILMMNITGVLEAYVIGVNDENLIQRSVAFVRISTTAQLTSADFKYHLKLNLPDYKIPKEYYSLPDIHKTGIKISRHFLKDYYHKNACSRI